MFAFTVRPSPIRLRVESESRGKGVLHNLQPVVLSSLIANWEEGANFSLLRCHCLGQVVLVQKCGLPSGD